MATSEVPIPTIPGTLLAEVERVAREQERSVSQVLADAVDLYVKNERWERMKAYGRGKAQKLGYTENDVERLIAETREELGPVEFGSSR